MREQQLDIDQLKRNAKNLAWPVILFLFLSLIGSPILNKATLFLAILSLIVLQYKDAPSIVFHSFKAYGLMLLMLWNVLSITWSIVPSVSTLNVLNDMQILLFAIFAAYHARNKDLAGSIKFTFMVVIAALVIYCVIFPGDSMSSHGLRSFYHHKNNLGITAGVSTLIILMTYQKNVIDTVFLLLSLALLILSQSKTSMNLVAVISVLVFLIYLMQLIYRNVAVYTQGFLRMMMNIIPFILYGIIGVLIFLRERIADYLISFIPFDALTGRGQLWVTVLTRSRDDLLIGIGQGVFWRAGMDSEIQQTGLFYEYIGWVDELISADGGYVDVIGAIGFVGLGLLLASFVHVYKYNFQLMHKVEWKVYFSLITFLVLHNVTETGFFKFTYPLWFILFLITFYLIFKKEMEDHDKAA